MSLEGTRNAQGQCQDFDVFDSSIDILDVYVDIEDIYRSFWLAASSVRSDLIVGGCGGSAMEKQCVFGTQMWMASRSPETGRRPNYGIVWGCCPWATNIRRTTIAIRYTRQELPKEIFGEAYNAGDQPITIAEDNVVQVLRHVPLGASSSLLANEERAGRGRQVGGMRDIARRNSFASRSNEWWDSGVGE